MESRLILACAFALSIASLMLAGCSIFGPPADNSTNATNGTDGHDYRVYGEPSDFFTSLYNSDNFSVVMDMRVGASGEANQTVIVCSTGIIGSWTELGKNISFLRIYALEGDGCIRSIPDMNETSTATRSECMAEYSAYPYARVSYGRPESYFGSSSWNISVDYAYIKSTECGFRPGAANSSA